MDREGGGSREGGTGYTRKVVEEGRGKEREVGERQRVEVR